MTDALFNEDIACNPEWWRGELVLATVQSRDTEAVLATALIANAGHIEIIENQLAEACQDISAIIIESLG